jgi:hypothetical protein
MKDLENFIHTHRHEFDVYKPSPKVWVGISAGVGTSLILLKLIKLFGMGSKNIFLVLAATSAIVATGIWALQPDKPRKTNPVVATRPADIKQAPEPPIASGSAPAPKKRTSMPLIKKEALIEDSMHPALSESIPEPPLILIPLPETVAKPADSSYSGIKTLTISTSGYNYKIRRSSSGFTEVHVLKPATVKNKKTKSERVLHIEQKGADLVFKYEEPESGANYRSESPGEIEILIPDGEISRITTASSNINLDGYTVSILSIQSASGNIDVRNLQGNLILETGSGDITLANSKGDISCQTGSGDISLDAVQGKLNLKTSAGSITGESVTLEESCDIQTVSGNVDLKLVNSGEELNFNLLSVSGEFKVKKVNLIAEGKQSLVAGFGKIPIRAKTVSGDQTYR